MTATRSMSGNKLVTLRLRLLQILRRQVTRACGGISVYEGNPMSDAEARRLEESEFIYWAAPLDGLSVEQVAHLTAKGESRLSELNAVLPNREECPVERILSLIGHLCLRKEGYAADKARAIQEQRWSQVPGLDGMMTGLLVAEAVLKEEIASMHREASRPTLKAA